ncbi:hypothetical protein [Maricaulis maris]|uniref:hypothetical protein n=1 Tax=Maricaulis maris TaxID=74318 RepID=UPI0026F2E78D|nr:hypothetical protein [Maricaulis maris]
MKQLSDIPEIQALECMLILDGTLPMCALEGKEPTLLERRQSQISSFLGVDAREIYSMLDIACLVVFGVAPRDLPEAFLDEPDPNSNSIELRSWGIKHGYNLSDQNGLLLQSAEDLAYVIEAIHRGIVTPNTELKTHLNRDRWAEALEKDAKAFKSTRKRTRSAA